MQWGSLGCRCLCHNSSALEPYDHEWNEYSGPAAMKCCSTMTNARKCKHLMTTHMLFMAKKEHSKQQNRNQFVKKLQLEQEALKMEIKGWRVGDDEVDCLRDRSFKYECKFELSCVLRLLCYWRRDVARIACPRVCMVCIWWAVRTKWKCIMINSYKITSSF